MLMFPIRGIPRETRGKSATRHAFGVVRGTKICLVCVDSLSSDLGEKKNAAAQVICAAALSLNRRLCHQPYRHCTVPVP